MASLPLISIPLIKEMQIRLLSSIQSFYLLFRRPILFLQVPIPSGKKREQQQDLVTASTVLLTVLLS